MQRVQISLPQELVDKLESEGGKKGIGKSEMIRYILFQYFDAKDDNSE